MSTNGTKMTIDNHVLHQQNRNTPHDEIGDIASSPPEYDKFITLTEIKVKAVFNGQVMVLYVGLPVTLAAFSHEVRSACQLGDYEAITLKWLDDEGDACTLSYQRELDEAVRLFEFNKDNELTVHVFLGTPSMPGLPCPGENKHVYRRGAHRWNKKFYRVNGHKFQAKRFNQRAKCHYCGDNMWGLGRQGYRCVDCRLAVHKKCHRYLKQQCTGEPVAPELPLSMQNRPTGNLTSPGGQPGKSASGVDNPVFSDGPEVGIELSKPLRDFDTHGTGTSSSSSSPRISLDDFNLLTVIGRGSYAKVLLVELKSTKAVYAMKIIKKQMFLEDEDYDWVQTEKSVFETASNHPFLVGLHSCFQTRSRLFFVIEFVPGGDLMFHMQRLRRLPEDHARFYAAEIVLALHFLHVRGIVYRDLKLDNVLIDADGHIKLTDYGMCKENIYPGDTTGTFCGTPNYIAPEILKGLEYSFSVDWWALGVLMYEMMAGRSPFDIAHANTMPEQQTEDYLFQIILEKQIRIPRALSVKASQVLKGFLAKEVQDRLGCAYNLEEAINDIKRHAFFRTVEWDLLEQRQVMPPYKPLLKDQRDLTHFDTNFTDEDPCLTPDDPAVIDKIDQSEYEGFEYINPLLMSKEDAV